jgi:hypothetical protein
MCSAGDCEAAHDKLATILESSPVRSSAEFRDLENRWADQVLAKADPEGDASRKRALYQRVSQAATVEPARRKIAADMLQELDSAAAIAAASPAPLPVAPSTKPDPAEVAASRPDAGRRVAQAPTNNSPTPTPGPSAAVQASSATPAAAASKPTGGATSVDDRERMLALGNNDAKNALKNQLEQKVYSGRATDVEINLLISTCKELGDKLCVAQARQIRQQRQGQQQ